MSESRSLPVLTGPDEDADRRHAERRNEDRRKIERTSVRSVVALLLAAAAVVLALIALWVLIDARNQTTAVQSRQEALTAATALLRQQLEATEGRAESNAERLAALNLLPPRVAQLADSISELRGRVDAGRRAWTLAESRYLLEVANRSLTLSRDVDSALIALEAADGRLAELRDPGLNAVRNSLAKEIQALRIQPRPDLSGIAARLAGAEELAGHLPVIGSIPDRYRPESTEERAPSAAGRAWQLLRSSVTNMISIRRIGREAVELVSLEEQNVRRQHMQLLLFSARLAAIRSDNTLFHRNIDSAQTWLAEMFDPRNSGVASVNEILRNLSEVDIAPALPDISRSLRMLDRLAFAGQGVS
jgi:uroporphyrin-3 C-methyltransferase